MEKKIGPQIIKEAGQSLENLCARKALIIFEFLPSELQMNRGRDEKKDQNHYLEQINDRNFSQTGRRNHSLKA